MNDKLNVLIYSYTKTKCIVVGTKPVAACPAQGSRARSTHAAIDTSVFDMAPSIKSWEEVPGPRPLPFLGNTWRFTPYIGK